MKGLETWVVLPVGSFNHQEQTTAIPDSSTMFQKIVLLALLITFMTCFGYEHGTGISYKYNATLNILCSCFRISFHYLTHHVREDIRSWKSSRQ